MLYFMYKNNIFLLQWKLINEITDNVIRYTQY
jgi:hypothetical protein